MKKLLNDLRFKDVRVLSHNEWVNHIPSPLTGEG